MENGLQRALNNRALVASICFALGMLVGFSPTILARYEGNSWKPITTNGKAFGASLSDQALFNDIPWEGISDLSGKIKFTDEFEPNSPSFKRLGYIVQISMPDPPRSKLPKKYLQPSTEVINGQQVTLNPSEHIYYKVTLNFTLIDKDGFELLTVSKPDQEISTGQMNHLQGFVDQNIPQHLINKTDHVVLQTSFNQCVTCQS